MYINNLPDDIIQFINNFLLHTCNNCNKRVYENEIENNDFQYGHWYINNKIIKNKCIYC